MAHISVLLADGVRHLGEQFGLACLPACLSIVNIPFLKVRGFYLVDMYAGTMGDMSKLGILEPYRVKLQMLVSAAEAAEMILRVDDIIKAPPRKRNPDKHRHH